MHHSVDVAGGALDAYVAAPAAPGPAVIVVGSVFGVTPGLREECDALANDGYLAVAPDLFWRTDAGPLTREQRERALTRYQHFDLDAGLADLARTIDWTQALPAQRGGVAILGYCFGGLFAFLGATRLNVEAGVAFHGTQIGAHLAEAPQVAAPLSLHFGENDDTVPMSEVSAIQEALASTPGAEIFTYPNARHGFAQNDSPSFDAGTTATAMLRARALLDTLRSDGRG